jgi:hypothetical protein
MRVFIEVRSIRKQFSLILDKSLYSRSPNPLEDFMREICRRVNIPFLCRVMILYLPPNHQLLDLDPIEKDDLITLGTR